MKSAELALYGLIGGVAGAASAGLVWFIASKQLDKQFDAASAEVLTRGEAELRATLEREIPLRVGTEIDRKLADVGITRDTGRQIANLLALTERIGLIGLPRRR